MSQFVSALRDKSGSFTPSPAAVLRRKCACGGSSSECEGCRKKETLHRSALDEAAIETIPSAVHETLRSPGRPLDDAARAFMEPRFGHDFSRVRVHTDAQAAESARQVHSSAYTLGQHIVFAGGSPSLDSTSGRHLLAHELAHAVQQEGVAAAGTNVRVGSPQDPEEHQAHAAAQAVETGGPPFGGSASGASRAPTGAALRRQPTDDNPRKPPEEKPEPFDPTGAPTVDIPGLGEMEVNPTVIAPDMEGVPDFMRGKEVKLSDLRKALDALGLGKGKKEPKGAPKGWCEQFQMERGEFPPVEGLCCPKHVRDPLQCCKSTRMDTFAARCCGPMEVLIQGRCVTPKPVPLPPKKMPTPKPPPAPAPAPAPVPVSTVVFFEFDKPGTGAKDEEGLRKGLTSEGATNFDALAKELKDNPTFKVELTGKASSEGPPWYNLGLAGRRARLVADVLVAMGVDRSRITEPPDGGSECKKVEDGIHNCGETGASSKKDPNDRQVRAQVFTTP
jgi:hypothetical protein